MRSSVFRRVGRNVGWLLGGRSFTGLASIGYLAFATRALGPSIFGTFSLILAYGGAMANLAQFRSWQAVIRYGAAHLAEGRPDRLARLVGFTAVVDLLSALVFALVAALGVILAGHWLGWTGEEQRGAGVFSAVLLLSTGGTASGILRLHDRFDFLAYCEAAGPAIRLLGSAAVWWVGGGLWAMLAVWAVAALVEGAAQWVVALFMVRTHFLIGARPFRTATQENPRVWGFMIQNSLSSSLGALWQQAGVLAVGAASGPAAAGAFRVAGKLAGALAKPAEAFTRVLYPELARLAASADSGTTRRVIARTTWVASIIAMLTVLIVWLFGPQLLRTFSGKAFVFAQPFLLLLTMAAAIDLCGIALEPVLNAYGRSGRVLTARTVGAAIYVVGLFVLLPQMGAVGAAVAAIVSSLALRASMAFFTSGLPLRSSGKG